MLFHVCRHVSAVKQLIAIARLHLKNILIFIASVAGRITVEGQQALSMPGELSYPALDEPLNQQLFKGQVKNRREMDGPERLMRCRT